jgi:hypothetical protein
MPSFMSTPAFLFRFVCLPLCILAVSYFGYALLRRRFEAQLQALSKACGANLFIAVPDALRTVTTLVSAPLWVYVFISYSVRVVPQTMAPFAPAFEKILDETMHTSAIDKLYVPSKGNRVVSEAETDLPLSVTYFKLGIARYRIELEDRSVVRVLLPSGLSTKQAQEQIESEPLLLTPVSKSYFTPQALELAQSTASRLTPAIMVGETIRYTAPFHSAVAATRALGWWMFPLLLLGSLLRGLQIRGLRRVLQAGVLAGRPARLQPPLNGMVSGTVSALFGVAFSRVETKTHTFITATPYRLAALSPTDGVLMPILSLPLFPRTWQLGVLVAGMLQPILYLLALAAFATFYQQVFIPEVVLEKIRCRREAA